MNQKELVRAFAKGAQDGEVGKLRLADGRLYYDGTIIAEREGDCFVINYTRYSALVDRVQSMLTTCIPIQRLRLVKGVPVGSIESLLELE